MSGEIYMEAVKATVAQIDEKQFIRIELQDGAVLIPMSDDKADEVKSAFNKLIVRVKKGRIPSQARGYGRRPVSQVANEYIKQLNREIKEIYAELKQHGLTT